MPPKEPTKHQLSNRLQFQSRTPNFLRAFQAQVSGFRDERDEDEPSYENGEEYGVGTGLDEFGREKRAAVDEFGREIRVEENSEREHGSKRRTNDNDDDDDEEKPVVVVLKEGKHLTEREAENERRKARGLSPLPLEVSTSQDNETKDSTDGKDIKSSSSKVNHPSMPKSAVQIGAKMGGASKRKAPVGAREDDHGDGVKEEGPPKKKKKIKGQKGAVKGLLSFGEDG